jgi:serine/threonine-protein kinase
MSHFFITFLSLVFLIGLVFLVAIRRFKIAQQKTHQDKQPFLCATRSALQKKYSELHEKLARILSHNYKDLEIIAEGGMGVIAKAYDIEQKKCVAIKTILPELQKDNHVIELFLQECQVIQSMNHPNLVHIFEAGQKEDIYYYIMDFLEGETLDDLMERKKILPTEQVLDVGTQVAKALQHIHANGLIHRDIKPSNIFITKDNVAKIVDFGVAKLLKTNENEHPSNIGGSPLYASPEQIRGEEVAGKSDIYSLGVCLFYMLSGQHPFSTEDLLAKMFETPKNLKTLNKEAPELLTTVIHYCLNVDPQNRISAHELWARLSVVQ